MSGSPNGIVYHAVEARARRTLGISTSGVYRMVADALEPRYHAGGTLLDVGCGAGNLHWVLGVHFDRYIGADVVRYKEFPQGAEFVHVNLDDKSVPLPDDTADVVAAVETIEHLENPRAFARELVRLAKPGGWVVVTTPNQLSLLSKMTLVIKNQFNAFQDGSYPAHLTALLESDLRRIAAECRLSEVGIAYSGEGRVAFTPRHYPRWLSRRFARALSDNVLLIAKK